MADVLAIKGSPRAGGNTDTIVDEAVRGAVEAGHNVTTLVLRDHRFAGCINCGACGVDGICHVADAMQELYPLLDANEHVILGAPMFFMGLPWLVKSMLDRCQCYWARKYLLKRGTGRACPGGNLLALLVGGTRFKTLFDAPTIVLRAWCAVMELELHVGLALREIDRAGDVNRRSDALARAGELGKSIAVLPAP